MVLQVNLKKVEEEILFLQNKIHLPLTDQDILTINTSIFMKEKASDLYSKQKSLFDKKLELDQRFHEEKTSLEELELKEETMKKELIPEFERKEIQHTLSLSTEKEHLIHQKEDLEERLTHLKRSHQKEVSRRKYDVIQYSVFALLFVVLCGFGTHQLRVDPIERVRGEEGRPAGRLVLDRCGLGRKRADDRHDDGELLWGGRTVSPRGPDRRASAVRYRY